MKLIVRYGAIVLFASAWLAADAIAQSRPGMSAPAGQDPAVESETDYALTLKDPFSPIGYRLPMAESPVPAAGAAAASSVPPPSINLKAKAKSMLRVKGILKRGNAYVANINGAIVRAGDEVSVTIDGQTVIFVVRAISLQRVQIEPRD